MGVTPDIQNALAPGKPSIGGTKSPGQESHVMSSVKLSGPKRSKVDVPSRGGSGGVLDGARERVVGGTPVKHAPAPESSAQKEFNKPALAGLMRGTSTAAGSSGSMVPLPSASTSPTMTPFLGGQKHTSVTRTSSLGSPLVGQSHRMPTGASMPRTEQINSMRTAGRGSPLAGQSQRMPRRAATPRTEQLNSMQPAGRACAPAAHSQRTPIAATRTRSEQINGLRAAGRVVTGRGCGAAKVTRNAPA